MQLLIPVVLALVAGTSAAVAATTTPSSLTPVSTNFCATKRLQCEKADTNTATCTGQYDECQSCEATFEKCVVGPSANHAGCAGLLGECIEKIYPASSTSSLSTTISPVISTSAIITTTTGWNNTTSVAPSTSTMPPPYNGANAIKVGGLMALGGLAGLIAL